MVMTSVDFGVEISRSRINILVKQLNQIESSLDNVARDIDRHANIPRDTGILLNHKYRKLINLEKKISREWNAIFETLLNFVPTTHKETSDAMVALVDLQLKGHNSEPLMKALRNLALDIKRCE